MGCTCTEEFRQEGNVRIGFNKVTCQECLDLIEVQKKEQRKQELVGLLEAIEKKIIYSQLDGATEFVQKKMEERAILKAEFDGLK